MTEVAESVLMLCVIAVLGLALGQVKLRGVGLGLGGVLFGGIAVGHFAPSYHFVADLHVLQFMQEFGLILFVYTIGIQVGPGFFAAMRTSGLRLNALSVSIVILGGPFANSMSESEAPALAYAAVYPVVMSLRILTPQVIAILLWSNS